MVEEREIEEDETPDYCSFCGEPLAGADQFCAGCGSPAHVHDAAPAEDAPPA